MAKLKSIYICQECGYETSRWLGKCPSCEKWNSLVEEVVEKTKPSAPTKTTSAPLTLKGIEGSEEERTKTNIPELDRVLSGGIVQGSLVLLGGDPGIGKSTLILQICQKLGETGKQILYVSGEESTTQIKLRAERLKVTTENLLIYSETKISEIEKAVNEYDPYLLIIDSIQTIYNDELTSSAGSVTQVRECTAGLMRIGKKTNTSIIIVGHVTKEGSIAGPRILEHMVDTVLYFEGERHASYRVLRAVKNRFGSTNEIGVFEMRDVGLVDITNPSEFMLSGRPLNVAGSVVTCSIEGTRPMLTEVQALVSYTNFGMPRRMATGMDYNRVVLLIAVLEKRAGISLGSYDSYVNLAGGIKIAEPSLDASVIASIASSFKNIPIAHDTVVFGEVGLTGEIRAVNYVEKRINEAYKLGFKTCVIPRTNFKSLKKTGLIEIIGVENINELLSSVL